MIIRFIKKLNGRFKSFFFCKKYHCKGVRLNGKIIVRGFPKLIIGKNVTFYDNVIIWGDGIVKIGNDVSIGDNSILKCTNNGGIYIGNNSSIAANCYLIDCNHSHQRIDIPYGKQGFDIAPVMIKNNCWIAANCTIAAGAIINNNCIIGANSFVNKEIEENTIAAGVPARICRRYNSDNLKWEKL